MGSTVLYAVVTDPEVADRTVAYVRRTARDAARELGTGVTLRVWCPDERTRTRVVGLLADPPGRVRVDVEAPDGDDLDADLLAAVRATDPRVRSIREDLETELSEHELDTIVHRSMAIFDRDRMDDVYFHLGEAEAMLIQHEVAMAVHLYLDDSRGVVVKIERDAEVTMPTQVNGWLGVLGVK